MISVIDIQNSITKKIDTRLNGEMPIIVEDTEGIFEEELIYVNVIPTYKDITIQSADTKYIDIEIKYFNVDNKDRIYTMLNILSDLFTRAIKVGDRYLNINSTNYGIIKDEVGLYLNYVISCDYIESINLDEFIEETTDYMENIEIDIKED